MTQLVRKDNLVPAGRELEDMLSICKTLASAPYYQRMGAGGIMAILMTSKELGLPFMACLNGGLYTFDGKVTMSAQLMNMMIVKAGHRVNVKQLTDEGCTLEFVRTDRAEDNRFTYSFTKKEAEKAGYFGIPAKQGGWVQKPKDNWVKNPRDMYFARALSGGARKFMPDVLMNCYVFGEIDDAEVELVETKGIQEPTNLEEIGSEPEKPVNELPLEATPEFQEYYEKMGFGKGGDIHEYVRQLAENANMTPQKVHEHAFKAPERFENAFNMWLEDSKSKADQPKEQADKKQQAEQEDQD